MDTDSITSVYTCRRVPPPWSAAAGLWKAAGCHRSGSDWSARRHRSPHRVSTIHPVPAVGEIEHLSSSLPLLQFVGPTTSSKSAIFSVTRCLQKPPLMYKWVSLFQFPRLRKSAWTTDTACSSQTWTRRHTGKGPIFLQASHPSHPASLPSMGPYLWISAMFVNQGNDGADVRFFDDIECFRTVNEYTVKHIKHTCNPETTQVDAQPAQEPTLQTVSFQLCKSSKGRTIYTRSSSLSHFVTCQHISVTVFMTSYPVQGQNGW